MKKIILITLLSLVLFSINSIAQFNPRMENENYMQTKLYDSFNSSQLNRGVWNVSSHEIREDKYDINLFIWVDSSATVSQSGGDLKLSMLHYPNFTTTDWDRNTITANFIAGQIETDSVFSYGVYECNATFANQKGSFPAFWSMSKEDCNAGIPNNEIDIVELKYEESNPTIDNGIFYYPLPCNSGHDGYGFNESSFTWGGAHTFKCIWKPSKIEFWVDNTKLKTVQNTGQDWYPQYEQRVILSQQITIYIPNKNNPPIYGIITPQTSNFHWVKVREFFLAPEITISSDVICTTGTAIMDVDSDATNITWSLSPSYLFSGSTSGTGKNASISVNSGVGGEGKITYSFEMPSGETFEAEETFWVGKPQVYTLGNNLVDINTGMPKTDFCYAQANECEAVNIGGDAHITAWEWRVTGGTVYPYGAQYRYATIYPNSYNNFMVEIRAYNTCGWTDWARMWTEVEDCYGYYMTLSPNPTTGETTLSIKSENREKNLDETAVWELKIYSPGQVLTQKATKLRGSSTTIQTAGWKEGVYTVRVKLSIKDKPDEILTGKLVVKK